MTTLTLTQTRIRHGKWEGILTGHSDVAAPRLRAFGPEVDLDEPNVTPLHDNDNS